MTAPKFTHREAGTAESAWWNSPRWDAVPIVDVAALARRYPRVLIASAHPDDETLGAGGLLTDLADLGVSITVLIATSGERCQPHLSAPERNRMAARRRREVEQAVLGLAPHAEMLHLGLPDTNLSLHQERLTTELCELSDADTLILAPWRDDGHTDHDALGRAAIEASRSTGAGIVHFPIWLWHWGVLATLPWAESVATETSVEGIRRKRAALDCFTSQLYPTSADPGEPDVPAILGPSARARSRRLVEVLIDEHHVLPIQSSADRATRRAARTGRFDAMYDAGPDPWRNTGSFYEERRRNLVMAMLGRARYGRVLELGCADGFVTSALLERADEVHSFDGSPRAVSLAQANAPAARVECGELPDAIPLDTVRFDLVVLSEVGYFLTATELLSTLRRARAVLTPGGELVLCHWQHATRHVPLDGILVHQQARDMMGEAPRARHLDEDLCIEIWGEGPSVAREEGRA